MGASEEEYRRAAPQHSFIHVNQFKGPKELAEYLHELDQNDEKYNEYFQVSPQYSLQKHILLLHFSGRGQESSSTPDSFVASVHCSMIHRPGLRSTLTIKTSIAGGEELELVILFRGGAVKTTKNNKATFLMQEDREKISTTCFFDSLGRYI